MRGRATSAALYQRSVLEADMERALADLVAYRGGRLFHVRRSDVAPELTDLLDWLIIDPRGGRVLHVEAKSQTRLITPGQAGLLELLRECRTFASGIVRPVPLGPAETSYDDFLEMLNS